MPVDPTSQPAPVPFVAPVAGPSSASSSGPQSSFGKALKAGLSANQPQGQQPGQYFNMAGTNTDNQQLQQGIGSLGKPIGQALGSLFNNTPADSGMGAESGAASAQPAPDNGVMAAAKGGMTHDYRSGGKVAAKGGHEKAVVKGDSLKNDKIPAVLSEHEIVLPRSVVLSKDPISASAKFVQKILAKKQMERRKKK
jgi:hypothetical protein